MLILILVELTNQNRQKIKHPNPLSLLFFYLISSGLIF